MSQLRDASTKRPRHIVLAGLNYSPQRRTGDKNFWADLVPRLACDLDRISVVSARREMVPTEVEQIDGCLVETSYVPPVLMGGSSSKAGQRKSAWTRGIYPRAIGLIEKQIVLQRIVRRVDVILQAEPATYVHLMDNMGPANRVFERVVRRRGSRLSVSAIAYERRGLRGYDSYVRLSYGDPSIRVIPYSRRLATRLEELGVDRTSITRIPWGTSLNEPPDATAQTAARGRLGLPTDVPIFLWAGFIQQIREPDFELAVRLATIARAQGLDVVFVFAFKPETFRPAFSTHHRPESGIHIVASPPDMFRDLRIATDALFSPIGDRDCIVAPPLTWIEMMAGGKPVLTTEVPGAEELVVDGRTGYLARDDDGIIQALYAMRDTFASMDAACREKAASDYGLDGIRRAYMRHWFEEAR